MAGRIEFDDQATNEVNILNTNVGISTTTPAQKLEVNGNLLVNDGIYSKDGNLYLEAAAGKYIGFKPKNTGDLGLVIWEHNSSDYGNIFVDGALELGYKTGSTTVRIDGSGYAYIRRIGVNLSSTPSYGVQIYNSASSAGRGYANQWVAASDERFKTNKEEVQSGLDKVLSMKPIYYNWLETIYDEDGNVSVGGLQDAERDIGFIAQDMNVIVPEAVSSPEDDTKEMWGIDYGKLAPVIVSAIQEQQNTIEILQTEIIMLRAELCERDSTYTWCE